MRNAKLLRTSSSQSVCVFCACRLSGDVVATRASQPITYAQRRNLSGSAPRASVQDDPPNPPSSSNSTPFSNQASWGGAARQSSIFPDAGAQARAALEAAQVQKQKQEQALNKTREEKSEFDASRKAFGSQTSQNRRSNRQSDHGRDGDVKVQDGPRLRFGSGRREAVQPGSQDRRSNNRNENARTGIKDRPRNVNIQGSITSDGQDQKSMPGLDNAKTKTEPKVQAPAWLRSSASTTPSAAAPSRPAWGIAPPSSRTSQETGESSSTSSNIFGQLDASRQALEQERTKPLQNAMAALRGIQANRKVQDNSRDAFHQSRGSPSEPSQRDIKDASRSSNLSAEEENVLQRLLARKSASASTTESRPAPSNGSVTWSPFGASDQSRNVLQKENSQRERQATEREERRQRYKITMSERAAPEDTAQPFDPEVSSNWSIFGNKRQQAQEEPVLEQGSSLRTPEDIDAKFEEYRRRRPSSGVDLNNIAYESREPPLSRRRERSENNTCVRCGQEGHVAVDCTNAPIRGVRRCHRCGEPGHLAMNCPSRKWRESYVHNRPAHGRSEGQNERGLQGTGEGFRIRRVTDEEGSEPVFSMGRSRARAVAEDEGDEDPFPNKRDAKPSKFGETPAEEPAEDRGRARAARRSSRFDIEEDGEESARPARPRRSRFDEDDDDDRPARGRRSRFDEHDDAELSYADFEGARERRMERKNARQAKKDKAAKEAAKAAARKARKAEELTPIQLPEFISVSNLAQTLGVRYENFVKKMEELGFTNHSHDHILGSENASLIAMEYDFDPVFGDAQEAEAEERDLKPRAEAEDKDFLPTRPPVVAIMGHVDHGKTTILDFLRKSSVAASEHGGITQHIGAFSVDVAGGKTITFLDTPGHAAFLEMRKRGATVTDIIILVVAADDSVKPQTIEAIKHAKAANVPVIVAINKIDKEEANVDRVKQDLARHEIEIEDFGGDTQVVPVSGKTGQGIDVLEENIVTLSEILDHRAETDGPVEGWVLEATTKKAGRVATVLVRRGTLSPGNIIVAGKTWARVRTLKNEAGKTIVSAGPGTPVEVDGWKDQPNAGDEALQAPTEQKATDVVEYRLELEERTKMAEDMEAINSTRRLESEKREKEKAAAEAAKAAARAANAAGEDGAPATSSSAEDAAGKEEELNATPGHQSVPFIIKADVSGSVEAVSAYLLQLSNPLCSPTLLRSGVGPVSEFDIEHAAAASGHIIAFNLPSAPDTVGNADKRGVKVIEENVIYRIVGDVKSVLEEKLPPVKSQRVVGEADVAMTFEIGVGGRKTMKIAGCKIRNGVIGKGSRVRVLRGEKKVYDGILSSLKNVKKDVQEMRKGTECGMGFEDWEDFEVGDQIQTYEEKVEKRTLQI